MGTTALHFVIAKLQEVIESRKLDLYFLSSLIWTFAVSAISFAVIYFGLFRMEADSFSGVGNSGLLDFIGFSFSTLMTSSISKIAPVSGFAQLITYIQLFVSLLLIVLLVFIILTSIREKYKKDLDDLVSELAEAADNSKSHIENNYQITMDSIEHILIRQHESLMKFMLEIRYGKTHAEKLIEKLINIDKEASYLEESKSIDKKES